MLSASRQKSTHHLRTPWRTRTARAIIKLTPAQKAAQKARRQEQKQTYQEALQEKHADLLKHAEDLHRRFGKHSVDYYMQEIMQVSRLQKKKKSSGSWNAYVSLEVKRMNSELPEGVPKKKVHELISGIAATWKTLSDAEKTAYTQEKLTELHDTREMRDLASHNVPISAFHDTRVTLDALDDEIRRLHARTGVEVALIAVRSLKEHYNRPHVVTTSDRVADFFELTRKENVYDLGLRMEAYMLSGVQESAAKGEVTRMYYHNFDSKITLKHGLILKNWPLKTFCSPSDVSSRVELSVLLNAWKSDTAHFHRMSQDEYDAWELEWSKEPVTSHFPEGQGSGNSDEIASSLATASSNNDGDSSDIIMTSSTAAGDPVTSITSSSGTTTPGGPLPSSGTVNGPLSVNFVNTVSTEGGGVLNITKKARKPRKDKGIPRKKRVSENVS
ncbi:hypothetical protein FPV67DRAFT_1418617 [Lyophyllum atratum]|nr:hypothetical protein FPV67DRAFT_1418617 [Lyophyllum atratum]